MCGSYTAALSKEFFLYFKSISVLVASVPRCFHVYTSTSNLYSTELDPALSIHATLNLYIYGQQLNTDAVAYITNCVCTICSPHYYGLLLSCSTLNRLSLRLDHWWLYLRFGLPFEDSGSTVQQLILHRKLKQSLCTGDFKVLSLQLVSDGPHGHLECIIIKYFSKGNAWLQSQCGTWKPAGSSILVDAVNHKCANYHQKNGVSPLVIGGSMKLKPGHAGQQTVKVPSSSSGP